MKHAFQPILSKEKYAEALVYIAQSAEKLCQKILGEKLPINTLTIFAQTSDEYDYLKGLLSENGPTSPFTHGSTFYVEVKQEIAGQQIKLLGVRRPDALRAEVGYADYPVEALDEFKNKHVSEITSGRGIKLLELRHPEFDVRGYILEK